MAKAQFGRPRLFQKALLSLRCCVVILNLNIRLGPMKGFPYMGGFFCLTVCELFYSDSIAMTKLWILF